MRFAERAHLHHPSRFLPRVFDVNAVSQQSRQQYEGTETMDEADRGDGQIICPTSAGQSMG